MRPIMLAIASLTLLGAAPAPSPGIPIGMVITDGLGKTFNGWLYQTGSMFTRFETRNEVTTGRLDCCVAMFSKGRSFIVARTEPLTRAENGGVIKEKVIATKRLDARPGEEQSECDLFGIDLGLSLRHTKTAWVRSVVVTGNGDLAYLEWKDTDNRCYLGD